MKQLALQVQVQVQRRRGEGRGGEGRGFGNEMHVVKARQCFKSIKSNAMLRTNG